MATRKRSHCEALLRFQLADQHQARPRVEFLLGQIHMGGHDLLVLVLDGAAVRNAAFAIGIDGDDLGRQGASRPERCEREARHKK